MDKIVKLLRTPVGYDFFRTKRFNKILVLAPHCDDEMIGCGGSLLKYLSMGAEVLIVFCTEPSNKDLANIRKNESREIWSHQPNTQLEFWEYRDGFFKEHAAEVTEKLIDLFNLYQPDMILLPWMIDEHEDHRSLFYMLKKAVKRTNIMCELHFYEIFHPLIANYVINVTKNYRKKIDMLKQYKSQLRLNIVKTTLYLNRYRASCINISSIKYMEAFFVISSMQIDFLEMD